SVFSCGYSRRRQPSVSKIGSVDIGRHAAAEPPEPPSAGVRPAIHLPLEDPYQMPNGYPVKASVSFGLYYPPGSALYHDTLAELWFASEEVAQVNGFIRAD
ncbi:sunset domain-containing protein, partial [Mycobacterium tuberculosis]